MQKPSLTIVWVSSIIAVIIAFFVWGIFDKKSHSLNIDYSNNYADYCGGELSECVGKKIKFFGMTTDSQIKHPFYPSGSYTETSLLANKRYGVVVIYTRTPLNLPNNTPIEVVGSVVDASVAPQVGVKMEKGYHDYQILVDEWKVWTVQ